MNAINYLFGEGTQLNTLQMCVRAFVTFIIMLLLINAEINTAFMETNGRISFILKETDKME